MKEFNSLFGKLNKNKKEQETLKENFKNLLNKKTISFETKLSAWESAPGELKIHYKKTPATKNKNILRALSEIREQLNHAGRVINLTVGLSDDLYIYHHNEYEEAFDSASHLKTQKDFMAFMDYVFKYNIGSFE